jgi:Cytochrome c3/Cytochrome c7 and related cytochrome c
VAIGKSKTHVKSAETCETCHVVTTWRIARFDHTQTNEPCETCHDRLHASGKPFVHIRASNDCGSCHKTQAWTLGTFDHTGVVDGCFKCHDGVTATGKSGSHLTTSNGCESCHNTVGWAKVKFDHSDPLVAGVSCLNCHDGRRATGRAVTHYKTAADCDGCHTTTKWAPAKFDHGLALDPTDCASCHRAVPNEHLTTKGTAHGKPLNHIKSSNLCSDCHHSLTSWAGAVFSHDNITKGCVDCHNGTTATGRSNNHVNVVQECASCHETPPTSITWMPAKFDHVLATNPAKCADCHDGKHVTSAGKGLGKDKNHLQTAEQCSNCHNGLTTWTGAIFSHTNVTTGCVTCHNGALKTTSGVTIVGKMQGQNRKHLTTSDDCESCHMTAKFLPAVHFVHEDIVPRCETCHDGFQKISTGKMLGKVDAPRPHMTTSQNCLDCHAVASDWKTKFDHTTIGSMKCESCHDGKSATGLPAKHVVYTQTDCASCHQFSAWRTLHFDHQFVSTNCVACHDGVQAISRPNAMIGKIANHIPTDPSVTCFACHTSFTTWKTKFDHSTTAAACFTCHDGKTATGKLSISGKHLQTSDTCENCHTNTTWNVAAASFNHTDSVVSGVACVTCHNGTLATGKLSISGQHVPASDNCSQCHVDTTTWTVLAGAFNHNEIVPLSTPCETCHNGTLASGKNKLHITSANTCASCHNSTMAWKPAITDHNAVIGSCVSCHDGAHATSKPITGKSNTHFNTTTACANCHTTIAWSPFIAPFDHTQAKGTCFSCHDGSHAPALSKLDTPGGHLPTSNLCEDCHTTAKFKPAKFDHTGIVNGCFTCHNGTKATGAPALTHAQRATTCEDCHNTVNWLATAKPDHLGPSVVGKTCFTCHNGTTATGKSQNHLLTSNVCESCHNITKFVPATFDHNEATAPSTCETCHNGTRATGKSLSHMPTSEQCVTCHTSTVLWAPAAFSHADNGVVGKPCETCHNGSNPPAVGKSVTHFKTSNTCTNCHKSTTTWIVPTGGFDHSDSVSVGVTCFTCHTGTHLPAQGKGIGHVVSGNTCGDCHATTAWKPAGVDHTSLTLPACFTCHNGTRASGKSGAHFATNNSCQLCHNVFPAKWTPAPVFDHTAATNVTNCYACHNGARPPASAKSAKHINSSTLCSACHIGSPTPVKWTPVLPKDVDHTQVNGTCFSCHNGTIATGKSVKHINSTTTCDTCHSTVNWVATTVAHQAVIGSCFSCHNGVVTTGKTTLGVHFNTTNTCELCHASRDTRTKSAAAWLVAKAAFDHSQTSATCVSCHAVGAKPAAPDVKSSPPHITTTTACINCHSTVNWTAQVIDHTQVTGACITCHDGKVATGMRSLSGVHFNTTTACANCHATRDTRTKSPAAWLVAKPAFDHSQAIGTCASCHTTGANPVGDVKSAGHFITTQACQVCHNTTLWTTLLPYSHASPAYINHFFGTTAATCLTCHKQNNEKITYKSPGLFPDCASCHSDVYKPDPHNKYGNVRYTFTELRDCTGACHIYTDQTLTKIQTNRATNTKHRPTSKAWN